MKDLESKMKEVLYLTDFWDAEDIEIWLDEHEIKYRDIFIFDSGDWYYKDIQGLFHLIRKGVELTKGIKAKFVWSYDNGAWDYTDLQGFDHLFRDGKELTAGIKALRVHSYDSGAWKYTDEMGNLHRFDKDGNEIIE
jgi:hypothetical protein